MRTSQPQSRKRSCQLVSGTTTRSARTPRASRLIITAGRTFRISSPTLGSRLTSQTSPLAGIGGGVIEEVLRVETCPLGQFSARLIEILGVQSGGADSVFVGRDRGGRGR